MASYFSFLTSKKTKTEFIDVNLLIEAADVLVAVKCYVGLLDSFKDESFDIISDDTNSLFDENDKDKDDGFVYLDGHEIAKPFMMITTI